MTEGNAEDGSQMTVCWCHSVQISYRVQLGKALFYLEKKSHVLKKCLDFSFSLFLAFSPKRAPLSFPILFFFKQPLFLPLLHSLQLLILYKKQTGPISIPNSWSAPPISMGAMSTMGRREVFCDLYSNIVLPHCPVCLCRKEKNHTEKC